MITQPLGSGAVEQHFVPVMTEIPGDRLRDPTGIRRIGVGTVEDAHPRYAGNAFHKGGCVDRRCCVITALAGSYLIGSVPLAGVVVSSARLHRRVAFGNGCIEAGCGVGVGVVAGLIDVDGFAGEHHAGGHVPQMGKEQPGIGRRETHPVHEEVCPAANRPRQGITARFIRSL
ncbi:hypothetical protein [Pseudarthrobacter sp. ATCC 49987]|uniref:hypothetical protein n=1 Tax=Pseudarthrobacter sp. ATCC 49987 TaxID=2698204 RepID=UPI00136939C3|nr:hypothetical protein [Pseudarthrobacter sp. ATCC 49987]